MRKLIYVHTRSRVIVATMAIVALSLLLLSAASGVSNATIGEATLAPSGESTLGDFVWHDVNLDGDQAGEGTLGINDVDITLYLDSGPSGMPDGSFDPGVYDSVYVEPPEDGLTTTADDTGGNPGWYDFSITADGNYF